MNKKVLIGLLVVICALVLVYIYQRLDWQERRMDLGWEQEAVISPYLATRMYLEAEGVDKVDGVRVSPSKEQVFGVEAVFLPYASFLPLPSQHEFLLEWVDEGGHLLVGSGSDEFPPILSKLGFSTSSNSLAIYEDDDEESEEELSFAELLREENERLQEEAGSGENDSNKVCVAPYDQCNELVEPDLDIEFLTRLSFEGDEDDLVINIAVSRDIKHPQIDPSSELESDEIRSSDAFEKADVFYWGGDQNGVRFVQLNYGEGLISIIVDPTIFNNAQLGHFDHAYLLQLLLANHREVLIVEGKHMPPLSTLVWRHYREALFGLVLILVLGAWYLIPRFGAIRDQQSFARRSREEGMRAIAQWHWRRSEFDIMVEPIRKEILQLSARRWPAFKRWSIDQQHRQIAELCQLEVELVAQALDRKKCSDEQSFLNLIQKLQIIRNCL